MTPKHLHLGLLALSLIAAPSCVSQAKPSAAIPATPVTAAPAPVTAPSVPAQPGHRAVITWVNGVLTINANNSSLNSILRDVALKTGMKIVGGVQEERVFGHYGPGTAAAVIAQLMDGAKCNVLLQSDTANLPVQLTLTPLTGGATPPNPMQAASDPAEQTVIAEPTEPQINPTPVPQPPSSAPANTGTPADVPAGSPTTTEQSPNGVKTPEEIFKQLQELRRRNQQTQ